MATLILRMGCGPGGLSFSGRVRGPHVRDGRELAWDLALALENALRAFQGGDQPRTRVLISRRRPVPAGNGRGELALAIHPIHSRRSKS